MPYALRPDVIHITPAKVMGLTSISIVRLLYVIVISIADRNRLVEITTLLISDDFPKPELL